MRTVRCSGHLREGNVCRGVSAWGVSAQAVCLPRWEGVCLGDVHPPVDRHLEKPKLSATTVANGKRWLSRERKFKHKNQEKERREKSAK